MDKRKLLNDIALIRKQIFALVSMTGFLLVIAATILGRGFDPMAIFINAVLGLLGFGAFGFLLGKLYETIVEQPLIESYRTEAQNELDRMREEATDRVAKEMSLSDVAPGMKVVEPVYSHEGTLLVREGALLSEKLIQTLRENDIPAVKIEAQRQSKADEE